MKIEEFGAPLPSESPERRYASLHRTIETGNATDRVWYDLVHTCLTLRKSDEALTAAGYIDDPALRERAQRLLVSQGAHGQQAVSRPASTPRANGHGSHSPAVANDDDDSVQENIVDAFRFLFTDQMPLTVIFATLTFPLVVGLGGFLTRDSHALLFPLIAMVPALSVVGLIGALGRRILLDASRGLDDPPTIPGLRCLAKDALRFLVDSSLVTLVFFAPAVLLYNLDGVSPIATLATLALGVFLMPMAMAIRQVTEDWRAVSPSVLFKAVARCGTRYGGIAAAIAVLFTPAGISAFYSTGSQIYLQVSVVGPLLVAPLFIAARLLGQMLHTQRRTLAEFVGEREPVKENVTSVREALSSSQRTAHRRQNGPSSVQTGGRRPAYRSESGTQPERRQPAPQQQRQRQRLNAPAHPEAGRDDATRRVPAHQQEQRQRQQQTQQAQRQARAKAAQQQQRRQQPAPAASEPAPRPRVEIQEVANPSADWASLPEDLTQIPGACVVSGAERRRTGAASSNQKRR